MKTEREKRLEREIEDFLDSVPNAEWEDVHDHLKEALTYEDAVCCTLTEPVVPESIWRYLHKIEQDAPRIFSECACTIRYELSRALGQSGEETDMKTEREKQQRDALEALIEDYEDAMLEWAPEVQEEKRPILEAAHNALTNPALPTVPEGRAEGLLRGSLKFVLDPNLVRTVSMDHCGTRDDMANRIDAFLRGD